MDIELSWLAYDKRQADRAWMALSIFELYMTILKDDFRKKVDPRTMLFHKSQHYLLNSLENIMKNGAIAITLEEYQANLFKNDIEELPTISDEFFFDFQILSYFTSLKMSDSYTFAESSLNELLKSVGYIPSTAKWDFLSIENVDELFNALMLVREDHIRAVTHKLDKPKSDDSLSELKNFVRNYIEFFNYAKNNRLEIFYYNNSINTKYWGNLIERKNSRNKQIVQRVYEKFKSSGKVKKIEFPESRIELRKMHSIDPIIYALLNDHDSLIKQKAAETLGTIGDRRAVPHLIEIIKDGEPEVKQEAARALGELRDIRALQPLIESLNDDSLNVVASAAFALYLLGNSKAHVPLVKALLRGIVQVSVALAFFPGIERNEKVIRLLIKAVRDKNVIIRREAAFILGQLKGREISVALIKALRDTDEEVVLAAATSLIRMESKMAKKQLKTFFHSSPLAKTVYLTEDLQKQLNLRS